MQKQLGKTYTSWSGKLVKLVPPDVAGHWGKTLRLLWPWFNHCLMNCECATMLTNNYLTMYEETLAIPLHNLLPPESLASQNYSLRSRAHNRQVGCQNILINSMTVILLSVCFIKTCTNPVLLTLWTRFLSFYRSIVESLNSLELIASPSSWLVAFWQLIINEYEWMNVTFWGQNAPNSISARELSLPQIP